MSASFFGDFPKNKIFFALSSLIRMGLFSKQARLVDDVACCYIRPVFIWFSPQYYFR